MVEQLAQSNLLLAQGWIGGWPFGIAESFDQRGIDGVVLGDDAFGTAVIMDPGGIGDGDGHSCGLKSQAHQQVVRTGSFTDDVDGGGLLLDPGDELAVALFGVGELPAIAFESYNESVFGDIDSERELKMRTRIV